MISIAEVRASIVIPHYNDPGGLALCLDSLARQTLPHELFEIIVVDNNSPCGPGVVADIVSGRARLLTETEQGAGPARNRGVSAARGEALAFIDADCVASERWLEEGLEGLRTFDIVGGRVDVSTLDPQYLTGPEAFEKVFAFDNEFYVTRQNFTITGNLFTSRRVFDAVGPFRNDVSEDIEWCNRAASRGYTLGYCDSAAIAHPARRSWSELKTKWVRISREIYALYRTRPLGKLRWLLQGYIVLLSIVPHGVRLATTDKLTGRGNRWRGFRTLAALRLWRFLNSHAFLTGGSER